jgi:hypothetical protein
MTERPSRPWRPDRLALRGRGWRALLVRVLLLSAVAGLLAAALVSVRLAPLLLEPNAYAAVTSIERSGDYRDEALLREAWARPVAALYAQRPYEFQRNQSFCGPASVADVLHSLGDPRSQDQTLVDRSYPTWFGYLLGGLTLDQEADLLIRSSGRPARVLRDLTLDQFRNEMRSVNDPRKRYVANFHRGPLFGRGHGHFSPLLAYLPDRDLVLVGDVNSEYRPFLVSVDRLWRATDTIDTATGKTRGLVALSVE